MIHHITGKWIFTIKNVLKLEYFITNCTIGDDYYREDDRRRQFYTTNEERTIYKQTKVQELDQFFRFFDGRSNTCFIPPPCFSKNVLARCCSFEYHGELVSVVSWSTRCVYFVWPDRPKFLTCITFGKEALSKWSSNVGLATSRFSTSSSWSRKNAPRW